MEFLINLVLLLLLQNRAYSTAGHSAVRRKSSYKGLVKRSRSISVYHEPSGGTSRKLLLMIVLYYISRLYETSAVIEIPNWAMNVIWHCTRFGSRSSVIDLESLRYRLNQPLWCQSKTSRISVNSCYTAPEPAKCGYSELIWLRKFSFFFSIGRNNYDRVYFHDNRTKSPLMFSCLALVRFVSYEEILLPLFKIFCVLFFSASPNFYITSWLFK